MLGVITTILTVILVFICLLMSLVILMQRPKQEGLGAAFGGGIADKMLGSGTTDFLQRATVMMGVAFFVLSLTIATLMAYDRDADRKARVDAVKAQVEKDDEGTAPVVDETDNGEPAGSVPPSEPATLDPGAPDEEAEVEEVEEPAPATVEGEGEADDSTAPPAEAEAEAEQQPAGDESTETESAAPEDK